MSRNLPPTLFLGVMASALCSPTAVGQTIEIQQKIQIDLQNQRLPIAKPDLSTEAEDAKTLREAGLSPSDPAGLLQFFRARTLAEVDRTKITSLIDKLASEDFAIRDEASQELEKIGAPAVALLRQRLSKTDDDPEVHFLCDKSLRRIEKVAGPAVSSAAARILARTKPAKAAETLIAYLPFADDGRVSEEVGKALEALALVNGRPDEASSWTLCKMICPSNVPSLPRRSSKWDRLLNANPCARCCGIETPRCAYAWRLHSMPIATWKPSPC